MIDPGPAALRREMRAHNRHALLLAAISALAAALAWALAWFLFVLILLGLVTSARGDFCAEMPRWIPATATGLAAALLGWGFADAWHRRHAPPPERPIIGWHLFADFLLLPARLTMSIGGNLAAIRPVREDDPARAWNLLAGIHDLGRAPLPGLAQIEPDAARRDHLLGLLQLLGYIDLHRGEEGWFHAVCSAREPAVRDLLRAESSAK